MYSIDRKRQAAYKLQTLKQFLMDNPAFTNGGMRALLAKRSINGLVESGAVKVLGTKILIDAAAFYEWIDALNKAEAAIHE